MQHSKGYKYPFLCPIHSKVFSLKLNWIHIKYRRLNDTEWHRKFKGAKDNNSLALPNLSLGGFICLLPSKIQAFLTLSTTSTMGSCIISWLIVSCCCQFCRLLVSTVEQCQMAALERLEADAKLKRQNFGSQSCSPPKSSVSSASSAATQVAAAHPQPPETSDMTPRKGTTWGFPEEHSLNWLRIGVCFYVLKNNHVCVNEHLLLRSVTGYHYIGVWFRG